MSKTNKSTEYVEYTVGPDSKVVKMPVVNEDSFTLGFRRKTRHLSEEAAQEEMFWLVIEQNLTDAELDIIDNLNTEEVKDLMEQFREDQEVEKK